MDAVRELVMAIPASGSIINAAAIAIGAAVGSAVGARLPERVGEGMMRAIGAFAFFIGLRMAAEGEGSLTMLVGFVAGTCAGEALGLKELLDGLGERIKHRVKLGDERFTDAFVGATIIFCVGSMAMVGSIEQGLGGFPTILIMKSLMDGVSSTVFGATMGMGTAFSAASVLLLQGAVTLAAGAAQAALTPPVVGAMTGVGGLSIVCIGLNLLGATKINTAAQLPGILFAALIAASV